MAINYFPFLFVFLSASSINSLSTACGGNNECYDELIHPKVLRIPVKSAEDHNDYWLQNGKSFVQEQINRALNKNHAKNVIFFIGDGMSLSTIAASRVYLGGEEKKLSFEQFPITGLVRTYCLDRTVPDSASTATSYLRGVKANYGTIGVSGQVTRKDCAAMKNEKNHVDSIAKWALDAGKSAGLVTTTRVTHASPAGVYAYTADRDWENDAIVKENCKNIQVDDIAYQLIHGKVGSKLSVILGGGRREFRDTLKDPEEKQAGSRSDGKDLIQEWLSSANNKENKTYVYNRDQLLNVDPLRTDKLLGLFQADHMLYRLEAIEKNVDNQKPTLSDMTQKAIEILQKNEKGYFLFVEGGKIDIAHHNVYSKIALNETAELSKAVEVAKKITNPEDTLILVSSDHSHTLSIAGYPKRHNNIFEVAEESDVDHLPYTTLNYANGQAFGDYYDIKTHKRRNPASVDRTIIKAKFPSTIPMQLETHGGEDVAVYATGPFSHLFTGAYEQSALPHLMAYAACIGNGAKSCK